MLSPSDRVALIREIARRLEGEDWPVIDLTLRQFELPWTDQWTKDKNSYVLEMLTLVGDDKLVALAAHLGYERQLSQSLVEPTFWRQNHFRLFISHLAREKAKASALQAELLKFQISAFVAHKDIEPTKEWEDEIHLALSTADAAVALLHEGFHDSNWTDQECGVALGRGLLCVTIAFSAVPYGFLGRLQAFKGNGKSDEALARELFRAFANHKQTRRRMADAMVAGMEQSNTYKESKDLLTLLEQTNYWDDRLEQRLRSVLKDNDQVHDAFGVAERIERLVSQRAQAKRGV